MMQDEDAKIDELIRSVQKMRGERDMRVSDEAVYAYLTGRATAEQKSEVRQALIQSAEFRKELLALSAHLQSVASEEAAAAYDEAVAPMPPVDVLNRARSSARRRPAERPFWERIASALGQLVTPPALRVLAPVGAVAVLVLAVAPRVSWSPIVAPMETAAMNPRAFALPPGESRGGPSRDHEEAARLGLRQCVRLQDGRLQFIGSTSVPQGGEAGLVAKVQLVGAWRRKLDVVQVPLGAAAAPAADWEQARAKVWLAILPEDPDESVELRSYALQRGSAALRSAAARGERAVLLVTYERDGRIEASPCVIVDMGSR